MSTIPMRRFVERDTKRLSQESAEREREVNEAVDAALAPIRKALELDGDADSESIAAAIAALQLVASKGARALEAQATSARHVARRAAPVGLSERERAMCAEMKVDPTTYAAHKASIKAKGGAR